MKRDSIFYRLFAQSPAILFELVPNPPANASAYRFDSIAVKEPKFEIDGVFLPPDDSVGVVYFCEFQMQKDEQLYERGFAESALYFYQNRAKFSDWQMVFIYPSRSTEQRDLYPHRVALAGEQVHRIFLDELGDISQLPLWVGLLVLTSVKQTKTVAEAQALIARAEQETASDESRVIMDMVTTIVWHRFSKLSRKEIEAMLDITTKETRLYQEGHQDGRQEGHQEGRQEGRQEGYQEAAARLIVRQLVKRFGDLSEGTRALLNRLPLSELEELSEALLDFSSTADLQAWLERQSS
ncbi:MAG: Rpn family recombination-promoting nuclease/putative transposase [Phormidesmis sp.]